MPLLTPQATPCACVPLRDPWLLLHCLPGLTVTGPDEPTGKPCEDTARTCLWKSYPLPQPIKGLKGTDATVGFPPPQGIPRGAVISKLTHFPKYQFLPPTCQPLSLQCHFQPSYITWCCSLVQEACLRRKQPSLWQLTSNPAQYLNCILNTSCFINLPSLLIPLTTVLLGLVLPGSQTIPSLHLGLLPRDNCASLPVNIVLA